MKVVANSLPPPPPMIQVHVHCTYTSTSYRLGNVYIQCNEYYSMLEILMYSNLLLEGMPCSIMYTQISMGKRPTLLSTGIVYIMCIMYQENYLKS